MIECFECLKTDPSPSASLSRDLLLDQLTNSSLLSTRDIPLVHFDDVITRLQTGHRCWALLRDFADECRTVTNHRETKGIVRTADNDQLKRTSISRTVEQCTAPT